jgi:hypothetical protein
MDPQWLKDARKRGLTLAVGPAAKLPATAGLIPAVEPAPKAKRPRALASAAVAFRLTVTLPLVVRSAQNLREHWAVRAKRVKAERAAVWAALGTSWAFPAGLLDGPLAVTLTRLGGRKLDSHDNLRSAFKAAVDEVALWLGCDDGDPRVTWGYAQRPGGKRGVEIRIETGGSS